MAVNESGNPLAGLAQAREQASLRFTDVPASVWYAEAVVWAAGEGIVGGSNGKYNPNGIFTRASIALLLYRTLASEARLTV